MQRRTILGGLAAGSIFGSAIARAAIAPSRPGVIVVGAGIAGIAAARSLSYAGCRVILLEARGRSGGRIHTSRLWPDIPVDLGASWIHGIQGNPVTALARAAGAPIAVTDLDRVRRFVGSSLAADEVDEAGEAAGRALIEAAITNAQGRATDIPLSQAVRRALGKRRLSAARSTQLAWLLAVDYEQDYGASLNLLSAKAIGAEEAFGGPDAIFPNGYAAIIDWLARGLDIRLNAAVRLIDRKARQVRVTLTDGTSLSAERVIVTVPLGVLKSGEIVFDPPLPAAHAEAIAKLGMGLLNKHWLRFDRAYWPDDVDWLEYVSAHSPGLWGQWVSLTRTTGAPVLLALSGAQPAQDIERWSDRAIIDQAMVCARAMLGSRLPDPVASQVTRWQSDRWTYGSYSFNPVGTGREARRVLARPVEERLFFAGEAASASYPGTVHGALLSGRMAAASVLARL